MRPVVRHARAFARGITTSLPVGLQKAQPLGGAVNLTDKLDVGLTCTLAGMHARLQAWGELLRGVQGRSGQLKMRQGTHCPDRDEPVQRPSPVFPLVSQTSAQEHACGSPPPGSPRLWESSALHAPWTHVIPSAPQPPGPSDIAWRAACSSEARVTPGVMACGGTPWRPRCRLTERGALG